MAIEDYRQWAESLLDPAKTFEKPEALKDLKVVELCTLVLGPSLPSYLAELGATVFKVELPGTGDTMRSLTPFAKFFRGAALGYLKEARNKFHIGIDVRLDEGKELFRELVKRCDVVAENLRAGTMDKWGLGYRQLQEINPKIIYIALNGFGQWGPYVERPSYDAIAQSESGMAWITGFPERLPLKSGIWLADSFGGLMGAVGVLAALAHRDRTGQGQYLEFSQAENLIRVLDWTWLYQHFTGKQRERFGNRDVSICPADIFQTQDDMVAIAAVTDRQFQGLCEAMGRPELARDERFATHPARLMEENATALLDLIREWAADKTYDQINGLAGKHGFGAHQVSGAKDKFTDEHLIKRNFTYTVNDAIYGPVVEEGIAAKLSETPGRIKWAGKPVGFDNDYVFRRFLGLTAEKLKGLEERHVIGKWADAAGRKPPEDWDGKRGVILG